MEAPKFKLTVNHFITGVIVVAVLVLVVMIVKTLEQNYDSEVYIRQSSLENEIQSIENDNLALQQEYYKSAEYLELAARMSNKSLPGEHLVILPETDSGEKVNVGVVSTPKDDRANFEKWLEFLFGHRKSS
jgi:hypothetical protein